MQAKDVKRQALGQEIAERRRKLKMSQVELGTRAGYQSGAGVSISRVEAGLTMPTSERLVGIADGLGVSTHDLLKAAEKRESKVGEKESLRDRARRLQRESDDRAEQMRVSATAFNDAAERARLEFYTVFVERARQLDGEQPPVVPTEGACGSNASRIAAAQEQVNLQSGVAQVIGGGLAGAAGGAAIGGAAAYGTFAATMALGTASTGAAISGLTGVAATNAAMAALGGGALAAGGAGMAGGALVLAGIVGGPIAVLGIGGIAWATRRNKKQQAEARAKLDEAEEAMKAARPAIETTLKMLERATNVFTYIADHAGHQTQRWIKAIDGLEAWEALDDVQRMQYQALLRVAGAYVSLQVLDFSGLLTSSGTALQERVDAMAPAIAAAEHVTKEAV